MRVLGVFGWFGACALLCAVRPAAASDADVGGYFRVMTRPDLQGGSGRLGYWNLSGRLLNEGPYGSLDLRVDVLEQDPTLQTPWSTVHVRVEGGSIGGADAGNGNLSNLRMSQVYMQAGNLGARSSDSDARLTWQVGTLSYSFGDLGLYDMRPAEIFYDTVGASARWESRRGMLLVGVGDSGYALKGSAYNTVFTPGVAGRLRLGKHVEVGGGGTLGWEPAVEGNRNALYQTPGVAYEDYVRGEIVERYLEENPDQGADFPDPEARSALSFKAVGYLGFGGFGPVKWNSLYANVLRAHPTPTTTESWAGQTWTIYTTDLTDERYQINVGDEVQLQVIPDRLDVVWGGLYGYHWNPDNTLSPGEDNRTFASTVLRAQTYLTPTVHLLVEGSAAQEVSRNGNLYREHADSVFANTDGRPDTRGLETGDTDTRNTLQLKGGVVLNPLGPGVYTRPSLRLLYGAQYSNQNNAFGNSFVETLDQYNAFGNVEQHWHHLVALESEVWF